MVQREIHYMFLAATCSSRKECNQQNTFTAFLTFNMPCPVDHIDCVDHSCTCSLERVNRCFFYTYIMTGCTIITFKNIKICFNVQLQSMIYASRICHHSFDLNLCCLFRSRQLHRQLQQQQRVSRYSFINL